MLTTEEKAKIRQIIYDNHCTPIEIAKIGESDEYARELITKDETNKAKDTQTADIIKTKEPLFPRLTTRSIRLPRLFDRE